MSKQSFKEALDKIPPKTKRYGAIAGALGAILVLSWAGNTVITDSGDKSDPRKDVKTNILTNTNTRALGIDGLSASVQRMRREISELNDVVSNYIKNKDEATAKRDKAVDQALSDLKKQVIEVQLENRNANLAIANEARSAVKESLKNLELKNAKEEKDKDGNKTLIGRSKRPAVDPFKTPNGKEIGNVDNDEYSSYSSRKTDKRGEPARMKIMSLNSATEAKETKNSTSRSREDRIKAEKGNIEFYIPSGSIVSAIMINGLDASTSQGAKSEPTPSLLRIEKDAILPNRYSSDIKGCFLLVSGHGDLSSERAFLRGETLSCIRNDGGVLEAKFPSYVVGEDGKAGMKGRLVSKQGQVIARTLVAGFASGVSKAFDVSQVQVLDTSSVGDSVKYQSNWSPQLAQGAAVEGASRALEKVADFYLKMAEQIFPVIEITAGRRVNVIVTAGTKLRLESINELTGDHASTPTKANGTIPAPMPSKNTLQTGAAAQAASRTNTTATK
jgi:conjugal transfer pilus assembly protein TraB